MDLAEQLIDDIAEFKRRTTLRPTGDDLVRLDRDLPQAACGAQDLESFEKAMRENHKAIAPSMIYAYAALKSGVPFANGAPNLTVDIPALTKLAEQNRVCRSAAKISRPARR